MYAGLGHLHCVNLTPKIREPGGESRWLALVQCWDNSHKVVGGASSDNEQIIQQPHAQATLEGVEKEPGHEAIKEHYSKFLIWG